MANLIRQKLRNLNIGATEAPVVLLFDATSQAENKNRFIIVGRTTIPRRQNLKSIIAVMPRTWGLSGIIHGRVVEVGLFQFIFPTEHLMESVLVRGPWSFGERMLVFQCWSPTMNPLIMNYIPFWIQIGGIPLQFLTRNVVYHIGAALEPFLHTDFNTEMATHVEFAHVCINEDITTPLQFQRYFQFTLGVNTLLNFLYERLRGVCEMCGFLTHESGACVLCPLLCPLCRGQVKGWTVVRDARKYLNSKKRSCMKDSCLFTGSYRQLKKHVKAVHPRTKPRAIDPVLEEKWKKLEVERERSDVITTVMSSTPGAMVFGDYVIEPYNGYDDSDDIESDDSLEGGYLDLGSLGGFDMSRLQSRSAAAISSRGLRSILMRNRWVRSRGGNRRRQS